MKPTGGGEAGLCAARRLGRKAEALLASPGFRGEVLGVLSDTAYLSARGGEILWIARGDSPGHRRQILAPFNPESFRPGQFVRREGSCLAVGGHTRIALGGAEAWDPRRVGPESAAPLEAVKAAAGKLRDGLSPFESGEGLGGFIPLLSAAAAGRGLPALPAGPLAARAGGPIAKIAAACLGRDLREAALAGRDLVGLGPGLTPSGDDFLGGFFFAASALGEAFPGAFSRDPGVAADLIEWARARTHGISLAILGDLALGHGPEPLHGAVAGLLRGEEPDRVLAEALCLARIGHSSGWDLLAGVLLGMLLVEEAGD